MQDMGMVATPLFSLLSTKVPYRWTDECSIAFEALKNTLSDAPVLRAPNWNLPFRLYTDAAKHGIGGILMQLDPSTGDEYVIEYASTKMTTAERSFTATYLEARAIVFCVKRFRQYILGHQCFVFTDHKALIPLFSNKQIEQPQLLRWLAVLMEYDLTFIYRPGAALPHVDALSRADEMEGKEDILEEDFHTLGTVKVMNCSEPELYTNTETRVNVMTVQTRSKTRNDHKSDQILPPDDTSDTSEEEVEHTENEPPRVLSSEEPIEPPQDTLDTTSLDALNMTLEVAQGVDPLVRSVTNYLKRGKLPNDPIRRRVVRHLAQQTLLRADGLLIFKPTDLYPQERIYVPEALRMQIIQAHHGNILTQHYGSSRTKSRIILRYYWNGMDADVRRFVQSCILCQQADRRLQLPGVNLLPPQALEVGPLFNRMSVDILGPLPESEKGNKYVAVFMEYLTRWPEAYPIATADAQTMATLIRDHIIPRFGPPQILLSDRGSIFLSDLVTCVCSSLGITQDMTTRYHPQANGLVERMNGTIARLLRRVLADHTTHQRWDDLLPMILYAIRITPNSTTGHSPFELLYGRIPTLPLDLSLQPNLSREQLPLVEWRDKLAMLREIVMDTFKMIHQNRQQVLAETIFYKPSVGESVWIYQPLVISKQSKSSSRKLHNPWTGPWVVDGIDHTRNNVSVYDAANPDNTHLLHLSQIKPYVGPGSLPSAFTLPEDLRLYSLEGEGDRIGVENQSDIVQDEHFRPPPEDGNFEVQTIVGHFEHEGTTYFVVRWKGYPPEDDIGLPESSLAGCKTLLRRYKQKYHLR